MPVTAQNKIYSNDGATLLYTTGTLTTGLDEGLITETGIYFIRYETNVPIHLESYIYEGNKKFIGVSTTPHSTIPEYTIGQRFAAGGAISTNYYIVESNITDLTNTTWYVPSGWQAKDAYGTFAINYSVSYDSVSLERSELIIGFDSGIADDGTNHIAFGGFNSFIYNNTAFTISITDGDDATNSSLISWLETNGIQLKVTDLTNTTWNIPAGWEAEAGYGVFYVEVNVDQRVFVYNVMKIGYVQVNDPPDAYNAPTSGVIQFDSYTTVQPNTALTVAITGGKDVTNPKLIAWLSQYGELQGGEEEPTDIKPIYLRKNGAWVKQDAYERQNGEWVQVSYADKI